MDRYSFLNAVHSEYVEELYQKYLEFPDSVEPSWKSFFQGYDFAKQEYDGEKIDFSETATPTEVIIPEKVNKEFKVINLINGYRQRGHLFTKTNPVRKRRTYVPTLDIENFGLTQEDLKENFSVGEIIGMSNSETLESIIAQLKEIYCDSIGIEYMFIRHPERVNWIQNWINNNRNHPKLTKEEKTRALRKITQAVAFENFLHTKFVGQKRFSLEGNESLIPALDELINRSAQLGVEEVVVGMAHRGRLNVLTNIFKKSYSQIFSEFDGKDYVEAVFSGDVKYHLGSTNEITTYKNNKIKIHLAPNPSHLEAVDPVVEGITRAKADKYYDNDYSKILPILIHGDAAIAGQGVVYEVIQMMKLDGYSTGGTIHIVTNNQIGFTTNYLDARSSTYCTDIAKVTLSPVLHVNADDVEAVIHAIRFAADYRAQFSRDVFIDLLGYRKYGHNEGDEPRFTQPKLYKEIAKHPNPREIYQKQLFEEDVVGQEVLDVMEKEFKDLLEVNFDKSKEIEKNTLEPFMKEEWKKFDFPQTKELLSAVDTKYPKEKLIEIGKKLGTIPEGKKILRKLSRIVEQRLKFIEEEQVDWALAEQLAYGSLLNEGTWVRLSGEDVERGTFSHRHAVLKTEDDEEEIVLLDSISENQGKFQVYNSHLSEYGVLGFDYGYSIASPNSLTIWEAQFGDFANGAQIIIDQYISASEDKWKIQSGIVLLLPHGYEGQGAEHSSARLERFLQLCANGNMYVVNFTTPANLFHALRRQVITNYRKPLVVMSPKSLLRHPKVISPISELSDGGFQEIIDDSSANPTKVKRLVLCSGKIYYELLDKKEELNDESVALVRIEQLYPIHTEKLNIILDKYSERNELIWVQEEPENMGAWWYILKNLRKYNIDVISPVESPSPATGSPQRFHRIHNALIQSVFENIKK
ncbi:MAG: 2-oxoglutarate dehydrogenase E1 component [Flavobacteriales bacterium]|nr:2-oxoglutarate dehydrogenase E1 component [Flavobacteriales bacterium]